MRVPETAHTARPWRIHEIAPELDVEDVWRFPVRIEADEFPRVVETIARQDTAESSSRAVRTLFAIRWKLGELLGWDGERTGVGSRVPTLRDRLPADLRNTPVPEFESLPFRPLYLVEDEFAAEVANQTMHGVMHLGRVPADGHGYHVQMAVLVKPNGLLGGAYMAAIRPFRHLIVYPALMREAEQTWARARQPA